jgi:hypothetical protein
LDDDDLGGRQFDLMILIAELESKDDVVEAPPASSRRPAILNHNAFHIVEAPLESNAVPNVNGRST